MTREEAIGHIKDVICENNTIKPNIVVFEQEKEALYMAIKALEQEPKIDRIEYGTDGNAYRLTISNGKEFEQEPCEDATLKDIFCMGCEYKEQEPCEDCISREHLLEEIASLKESPWFKDDTNCAMAIRKEAIEIVEDLCIRKEPSVTPHQATCEEREKGECPFYAG